MKFQTAVGAYGTAIAKIKLADSGGTDFGGVDETVTPPGPTILAMLILVLSWTYCTGL